MKTIIMMAAAFAAAGPAYGMKPKPAKEPAPPPAVTYEMDDTSMGEALDRVCLAEPLSSETYDSEDNMLIVALADGGKAFLHLAGDCDITTLMFAVSAKGGENNCMAPGDDITFVANSGSAKTCKITAIHNWTPAAAYDPYE